MGQMFVPRPLSPIFDDSFGESRPARWHRMISGFTEKKLHTFIVGFGIMCGIPTTPPSLTKGKRKHGTDIYMLQW